MTQHNPSVTVVVNTLGRASLLADTLRGLADLRWPQLEVVVVTGPGDEATEAVLAPWRERIKVGRCPEANLSMSRNIGLSLAAGEIIAFIDDDAIPHPLWLEELTAPYLDVSVGAAGGHTIGRLGSQYQARTTLCDRYGDPYFVGTELDLDQFCKPGSWIYPSLLGTNCSFRRDALAAVGGFDEIFSYYLEETDLCLRLVDNGWKIAYVPEALVWHQFASSALRSADMTRRSIRAVMRSQSYFINRHGLRHWSPAAGQAAADRIAKLSDDWALGNKAACASGAIDQRQAAKLDRERVEGLEEGYRQAQARFGNGRGHWQGEAADEFCQFRHPEQTKLTIALVCRSYMDWREAGIARWTRLLAAELALRGHTIHIICETKDLEPRIRFTGGVWTHEIPSNYADYGWICERYGMPADQAQWAASVREQVDMIRSFGLDVLSFPIWDLEGIACVDIRGLPVIMSLHTTYSIAERFRSDWAARPILRERLVAPMKAAETMVLAKMPCLLANSRSIVAELESETGLALASKSIIAVHGVPAAAKVEDKDGRHILFVGRFEQRKGIDIALAAFVAAARDNPTIVGTFVGEGELRTAGPPDLISAVEELISAGRLELAGIISREELDGLYARADLALLPSRYESFGLVAIEAMAHGCVVAALDCGGMAEVLSPDEDSILVPADDHAPERLATGIIELLADQALLRDRQAVARRNAAQHYSLDQMARDVETALFSIVDREQA